MFHGQRMLFTLCRLDSTPQHDAYPHLVVSNFSFFSLTAGGPDAQTPQQPGGALSYPNLPLLRQLPRQFQLKLPPPLPRQLPRRLQLPLPHQRLRQLQRALAWISPALKDRTVTATFVARSGAINAVVPSASMPEQTQVSPGVIAA